VTGLVSDYRDLALEQTSDDLQDLAEQLSGMRSALLEAIAMIADRDRRLERSRDCYARDAHRCGRDVGAARRVEDDGSTGGLMHTLDTATPHPEARHVASGEVRLKVPPRWHQWQAERDDLPARGDLLEQLPARAGTNRPGERP
jgi:hypothetical protein